MWVHCTELRTCQLVLSVKRNENTEASFWQISDQTLQVWEWEWTLCFTPTLQISAKNLLHITYPYNMLHITRYKPCVHKHHSNLWASSQISATQWQAWNPYVQFICLTFFKLKDTKSVFLDLTTPILSLQLPSKESCFVWGRLGLIGINHRCLSREGSI